MTETFENVRGRLRHTLDNINIYNQNIYNRQDYIFYSNTDIVLDVSYSMNSNLTYNLSNLDKQNRFPDSVLNNFVVPNDEYKDDCAICQDSLSNGVLIKLNCTPHCVYHKACITPWFKNHNTCPKCRSIFSP